MGFPITKQRGSPFSNAKRPLSYADPPQKRRSGTVGRIAQQYEKDPEDQTVFGV